MNILKLDGWKNGRFYVKYIDSELKILEIKASFFHNKVEEMNVYLSESKFIVQTSNKRKKKKNKYELSVKIKEYVNKKQHEHKENTHRQKINI